MSQFNNILSKLSLTMLIFGLNLLISIDAYSAEGKRPITVEDLNLIKDVSEPQVSPDGLWVAYIISEVDVEADVNRSDIWLTSWDGSKTVQLTSTDQSEHTPRWSPDGRLLAFLSTGIDTDTADQVWLIDPNVGKAQSVTSLANGVSDFDWGPDSQHIALISGVVPDGSNVEPAGGPLVIDRMLFKRDGYGYFGKERSRVHLLDLKDLTVEQLTNGPFDEIMPSFSPDGKHIAYVTKLGADPDRHENWDILTIELSAGAKPKRISEGSFMECDPIWGWGSGPTWSPDSRKLACIQSGPLELSWFSLQQLVIFGAEGDQGQQPTVALDRNTLMPQFSSDSQHLFFIFEDDQSTHLASVGIDGKGFELLTKAGRTVSNYSLGPKGKIAVLSSTPDVLPEIYVIENDGLRQLTHANTEFLASVQLASTEVISYPGADGAELHGLIMKPSGFRDDIRYPTILRLHGGPVSQWQQDFNFDWQVLAASGYVVFGPNTRGSSGRGVDFQKTVYQNWGNADVPDVLAATDYLIKTGIADENKLGVGGWSAGAMLTNYTIASDVRFKAATSGAGISNMLAGFGTDEWWQDWEAELGLPWETPENWARVSYPFLHADRIKTPTLFLCGTDDYNVPLAHSEQMYMALKRLEVPTRLIIYPGESHSISKPSFYRDVLVRYLDWYDQWLQ